MIKFELADTDGSIWVDPMSVNAVTRINPEGDVSVIYLDSTHAFAVKGDVLAMLHICVTDLH